MVLGDLSGGFWCLADVGAASLRELSKRTTFIMVTQQLNEVFGDAESSFAPVQPTDGAKL